MNAHTSILLLAALYHESGRYAVQQGQTLAHAVGQPRPAFTEFADLPPDAMRGRMLTAELLLRTHELEPLPPMGDAVQVEPNVDALAQAIHRAERGAVRRGLIVVKLSPPRPWIPFEQLPEAAQSGRRHQARYFLSRFAMRPRPAANIREDFDRALAAFLATPHGRASNGSRLRWTGTPAEVELLFDAVESIGGKWRCAPLEQPASVGTWRGVALYEDERGGGFAAEGVGGFTDPTTGTWIETITEGTGEGPTLISSGVGHQLVPVGQDKLIASNVNRAELVRMLRAAQAERDDLVKQRLLLEDERDALSRALRQAAEDSVVLAQKAAFEAGTLSRLLRRFMGESTSVHMGPWKPARCASGAVAPVPGCTCAPCLAAPVLAEFDRSTTTEVLPDSESVDGWRVGLDACARALAGGVQRFVSLATARVRAL